MTGQPRQAETSALPTRTPLSCRSGLPHCHYFCFHTSSVFSCDANVASRKSMRRTPTSKRPLLVAPGRAQLRPHTHAAACNKKLHHTTGASTPSAACHRVISENKMLGGTNSKRSDPIVRCCSKEECHRASSCI